MRYIFCDETTKLKITFYFLALKNKHIPDLGTSLMLPITLSKKQKNSCHKEEFIILGKWNLGFWPRFTKKTWKNLKITDLYIGNDVESSKGPIHWRCFLKQLYFTINLEMKKIGWKQKPN
jgi:hypothetical protein